MVDIITRAAKGSPLTYAELDGNFTALKAVLDALAALMPLGVTSRPTIGTDGTPQVGETLTGNTGVYVNGVVTARAWLLGGTAIGGATGATYVPAAAGALVYTETVTGPAGTITSSSDPLTVAAATVPQLTLAGPLTYGVGAAAGSLIANIGNVPAGVTPTITPGDGRMVVAGSATSGWKVVVGMTAASAGTIALAVSAAGAAGAAANILVSSAAVASAALPRVAVNVAPINFSYASTDCAWLNVIHGLQGWTSGGQGLVTLGADGFPVSTASGGFAATPIAIDNDALRPGCETDYVIVTSRRGWNPSVDGMSNPSRSSPTVNGVQVDRVEFSMAGAATGNGNHRNLTISNVDANPWRDGQDFFYVCRKSDEAKHLSGRYITDEQLAAWAAAGGGLRFMDAMETNGGGDLDAMSKWTKPSNAFWGSGEIDPKQTSVPWTTRQRWPIEVICGAANELLTAYPALPVVIEINVPYSLKGAEVRAFTRAFNAHLNPAIPRIPEASNENWNFSFPTNGYFRGQNPTPAITGLIEGDPTVANAGYRAAQVMALILDEDGYSGKWLPALGTHAATPYRTQDGITGARAWMTNVRTPGNPDYDATLAPHYDPSQPLGQLFVYGAPANYMGLAMSAPYKDSNGNDLDYNRSMLESWADATTSGSDTGLAAGFDELYNLDQLPVHAPVGINGIVAYYAQHLAFFQAENMGMIAYEGGYIQENYASGKVQDFSYAMRHDAVRARKAQHDTIVNSFLAGFQITFHYFDCNGGYGGYQFGLLDNLYDKTMPIWLAQTDAVANPPALLPLKIRTVTYGAYTVGKSPVTTAFIVGGQAPYTVTWKDLAPGRVGTGKFCASGNLTAVGDVQGTAIVTDATGATAQATFDQNVIAPPAGYRFFKVRPTTNFQYIGPVADNTNGSRVGTAENVLRDSNQAAIVYGSGARCVSDSNFGSNPPARVVDNKTDSSYLTENNGKVNGGEYIIDLGDGSAAIPASMDIYSVPESPGFRIGGLDIWVASDPGGLGATPTYDQIIGAADFSKNVAHFVNADINTPSAACSYTDSTSGYWRVPLTYPAS